MLRRAGCVRDDLEINPAAPPASMADRAAGGERDFCTSPQILQKSWGGAPRLLKQKFCRYKNRKSPGSREPIPSVDHRRTSVERTARRARGLQAVFPRGPHCPGRRRGGPGRPRSPRRPRGAAHGEPIVRLSPFQHAACTVKNLHLASDWPIRNQASYSGMGFRTTRPAASSSKTVLASARRRLGGVLARRRSRR